MGVFGKVIKGFFMLVGGAISILFLLGLLSQALDRNESIATEDQSSYIDESSEYGNTEKEYSSDTAYDILEVLNKEFEDQGYFGYNKDVNAYYMTITDEKMIEMAKIVSKDENSEYSDEWKTNVTDVMVDLSGTLSEKLGEPTGVSISIPWEYDDDGVTNIVSAIDGKLISAFGKFYD